MKTIALLAWIAGAIGFGLLIGGVALMHVPSAYIIAGLGLLGWAWIADRAAAQMQRRSKPGGG